MALVDAIIALIHSFSAYFRYLYNEFNKANVLMFYFITREKYIVYFFGFLNLNILYT